LVLTALVALFTLAATACSGSDSSSPSDGGLEKSKIKVTLLAAIDVAPFYLAIKEGYFQDEGLTVEPEFVQSGAKAIGRLGKDVDMTFVNYVSLFQAAAKGQKFKLASDGYQAKPGVFVVLSRPSGPTTPQQLKGKKIAINASKNVAELTAKAALQTYGVAPDDVTYVEMPFPAMAPALQNGNVDAIFTIEPFTQGAKQAVGAKQVFDAASGPTADIPIAGWGTTEKWAKENPKTFAAFSRAMAMGQQLAADRAKVEAILPTYTKIDAKTASLVTLGIYPTTLNPTRLERVTQLLQQYGFIQGSVDVGAMLSAP
jgi:NitT/TauT family transport system substrate-binding protein